MLKTVLMLLPVFAIIALAFWFLIPGKSSPFIISDQKQVTDTSGLFGLSNKVNLLEEKVDSLESSNSALLSKISKLESGKAGSQVKTATVTRPQKSPVLIPINPGGNINTTDWSNLTSGSITIDPANYPGYKNAYLIISLSVNVGQGKASARLVNPVNSLAILGSEMSTTSDTPVGLTSGSFNLPPGLNTYTIQLKTLVRGYPAQAADSFLQITY